MYLELCLPATNRIPTNCLPFLNTWRKMYAVVLINLVVLILSFYGFTLYFE